MCCSVFETFAFCWFLHFIVSHLYLFIYFDFIHQPRKSVYLYLVVEASSCCRVLLTEFVRFKHVVETFRRKFSSRVAFYLFCTLLFLSLNLLLVAASESELATSGMRSRSQMQSYGGESGVA